MDDAWCVLETCRGAVVRLDARCADQRLHLIADLGIDNRGDRMSAGSDARSRGERKGVWELFEHRRFDELLRAFVQVADLAGTFGQPLAEERMNADAEDQVAADGVESS